MRVIVPETPEYVDTKFTAENDLFNLRGYAEQLSQFIENSPTPMTMVLHGGWGSGKTVFARQWHATLKVNEWNSIYFDCYAHDYHDDPLLPLAAAILARFTRNDDAEKHAVNNFQSQAIAAARALLPLGARMATHYATAGMVGKGEIDEAAQRMRDAQSDTDAASDPSDSALLEQLFNEMGDDSPREGFRRGLQNLVESANKSGGYESSKPLILILDELDRCRPDFALRLLERIKHFFAVPGICFFFVSNLEELRGIVSHQYGLTDTSRTYLEKFFDVQTIFPALDTHRSTNSHERMMSYILEHLVIPSKNNRLLKECFEEAVTICKTKGSSLRTFQRIGSHIALYFRAAGDDLGPPPIVAGMAILKQINPVGYRSAANGEITWDDAKNWLDLNLLDNSESENDYIIHWWKYATDHRQDLEDGRRGDFERMVRGFILRQPGGIPAGVARDMDSFASFENG